jgi:hypothetical protein
MGLNARSGWAQQGLFLLEGFDGDLGQRSIKVSAALGEINPCPHRCLKCHLSQRAEAGPGTKHMMEPQHCFHGRRGLGPPGDPPRSLRDGGGGHDRDRRSHRWLMPARAQAAPVVRLALYDEAWGRA